MIIDAYALLHRAWHALPPLNTKKGELVNAVFGFTSILLKALKELKPTYVALAFDRPGPTFRHKAFTQYKAQREKQPQEFYNQIERVREILSAFDFPIYEKDGFEADDVIATVCKNLEQHTDIQIIIVTGDMDALQLVNDRVHVYTLKRGIGDTVVYDVKGVQERYDGLEPQQLVYYKALRGDQSDNIPGVKGIGEKTAIELIKEFKTIDTLYSDLESKEDVLVKASVKEKLLTQKEEALKSLELVKLVFDVPISFSLSACTYHVPDKEVLKNLFQELEFKTLLGKIAELPGEHQLPTRFTSSNQQKTENETYYLCDTPEKQDLFLKKISKETIFAFDTETTNLNALEARLVGLSFCWNTGVGWYLPWLLCSDKTKKEVQTLLENPELKKVGHNSKYDIEALCNENILVKGLFFDTMIAAYLLNPGVRGYGLDELSFSEFGYQKISTESLIGTKKEGQITMDKVPIEKISEYACEDADMTWRLYEVYNMQLQERNQLPLLHDIEVPAIMAVCEMERNGIRIDVPYFKKLSESVKQDLKNIEEKIYREAGEKFNINSPLQLKKILFETLAISQKGIRKKKTGLSTAASELEKMKGLHPIIDCIIEYRELAKLQNTYLEVLLTLISAKTGRIHTSFNQTIAATGRFSSTNPNLQNIPVRTSLGQSIRRGFVAEKGYSLVSLDYSQLELRIVASLSNDEQMIDAFQKGYDIHTATAAVVNGIPLEQVTKEMRRAAKAINFGIMYGMGPMSLAQSTGLSMDEARDFIDRYFLVYDKVKQYLNDIILLARANGYVETYFGRRRYIPDIYAQSFQLRQAAERAALNMPIQGTNADIVKLAMSSVFEYLTNEFHIDICDFSKKEVRMLLQVHDELVFEIKDELVQSIVKELKNKMEHVATLAVPLIVDVSVGPNWADMKKISN